MIVPPLVVIDDEGMFEFFRSSEEALAHIPLIELDIWQEFAWYDSEGRRLTIREEPPPRRVRLLLLTITISRGELVVSPVEGEPAHAAELARRLRDWMRERGVEPEPDAALAQMIELAMEEAG